MTVDEIENLKGSNMAIPSFASFSKNKLPMPGRKRRIDDILNKEILIVDFRITESNKRDNSDCLQLQFIDDGEVCVLFTGSNVLIDQIREIKENIPFKTIIVHVDKYYSFS